MSGAGADLFGVKDGKNGDTGRFMNASFRREERFEVREPALKVVQTPGGKELVLRAPDRSAPAHVKEEVVTEDILSSTAIIEFMKKEKERGKTVIYSTHYMEEAEYLCDRIIMLNKGKAITNDSPEQLKAQTGTTDMRGAFYEIIKAEGIAYEE